MHGLTGISSGQQTKSLAISTLAFTICFAVWTIFSIIGIKIKQNLGLSDTQFGLLVSTPILTGSLSRIFLGIWTDQYGGRIVYFWLMLSTSLAVWMLSTVSTYEMYLVAALGVGLAGGSFAVGIAYVSRWYDSDHQGTALGIFGMGNVGAAVTNFGAPFLLVAYGWENVAKIYAVALFTMAIVFWFSTEEDPSTKARKESGQKVRPALMQLEPLKYLQVWRFATYYFFVFGAYVALALWLPRYYMGVYGLEIQTAGMLAAAYALPGSIFRALGGWMSDKIGARRVMYLTFISSLICLFFLSYPATNYSVHGIKGPIEFTIAIGLVPFVILTITLGFFMSLGKAAVYKHIPVYYPDHVGSVGGLVGMIGGLGGFILPICFGLMNDFIGIWTSCFMLLFVIVGVSLIWMHTAIILSDRTLHPELKGPKSLPEMLHLP
ncbi:MAG: nitrate/nitrite transporter [Methyloprofundus sp.]|nr:NarK/NasA family nitrate transporter [Methyloprofundus sp.]MDT8426245.1 nitrate/nitrite transporter [Methyloprofundus sp.]